MRQLSIAVYLLALLAAPLFASKDDGEFPLVIHITAVHMEQGVNGVSGSGSTDANGNYSSSVSGGGSYTWKLYTAQIEGDKKIYELSTPRMHYKGGKGLAIATLGWSEVATARPNHWLHVGTYHGRWNKDGTLEVQFHVDADHRLTHQTFHIQAEEIAPTQKSDAKAAPPAVEAAPPTPNYALIATTANIVIDSTPSGADIEIDDAFVGNTPSTVSVPPGSHKIAVKKKGFADWTKTLNVSGGSIHLSAELDPDPPKQ